jgi:hypothetical protein
MPRARSFSLLLRTTAVVAVTPPAGIGVQRVDVGNVRPCGRPHASNAAGCTRPPTSSLQQGFPNVTVDEANQVGIKPGHCSHQPYSYSINGLLIPEFGLLFPLKSGFEFSLLTALYYSEPLGPLVPMSCMARLETRDCHHLSGEF